MRDFKGLRIVNHMSEVIRNIPRSTIGQKLSFAKRPVATAWRYKATTWRSYFSRSRSFFKLDTMTWHFLFHIVAGLQCIFWCFDAPHFRRHGSWFHVFDTSTSRWGSSFQILSRCSSFPTNFQILSRHYYPIWVYSNFPIYFYFP